MGMVLRSPEKHVDDRPLCSVCIANFNGEPYLAQCIDSVLGQRAFPGGIEIIVHDDASTDGSIALIQARYPQVRLLPSAENVGFCVSNNRMVAHAQGTFILLLNNDAVLHSDALKTLFDASTAYGDGVFGLPQYDAETGDLIDIGSLFDPFLNPIPNTNPERTDVGMIIGACLWLPKTLWERVGGFPEWFGSLAEDMFLCCVARLQGYPVKAVPRSGFDHWVGRSFGGGKVLESKKLSTSLKRRALSERNKTYVMITCYPSFWVWFVLLLHLAVLGIEGVVLSLVKHDKQLWRGIYWHCLQEVWVNKNSLLEARGRVQRLRKSTLRYFFAPFVVFPHKLRMLLKYGMPHVGK